MTRFSSKWILSHSTWYKNGRSRHLVVLWEQERTASEELRNAVRFMPGMNTGHPDLFRAFTWRFLQLVSQKGGRIGVVLPGDAFKIAGGADVRERLATASSHLTPQMLTNKAEWVFDDVDPRKLIALVTVTVERGGTDTRYHVSPEFHDKRSWDQREREDQVDIPIATLRRYSPTLVIPLLPSTKSFPILEQFMKSPQLCKHPTVRVRRVYADFETSKHDKQYWHNKKANGDWPVYAGESFDIWTPDTGKYYAFTNAEKIKDAAHQKWKRASRSSPYSELPKAWREEPHHHPIFSPRIAFRDVTNRTNTRTLVVALIPPEVVTVQTAPWVLWLDPKRPAAQEAYLLGVLSSVPLDWWARRFVEQHADQEAFNSLRIPELPAGSGLSKRVQVLAGRLAAQDERFAEWANNVGVKAGKLQDEEHEDMINELDAVVAHLYGLTEPQLRHIFETFHDGWEYQKRLEYTLIHYKKWQIRL